jgi:eukaryotic-like serine/threonine-protein kinase
VPQPAQGLCYRGAALFLPTDEMPAALPSIHVWALVGLGVLLALGVALVVARRRRHGRGAPVTEPASAPLPRPPPAARHIGRYRVERELERGAMGALYLGSDPESGRKVALKTLALGREFEAEDLAEARNRFLREAEAARRLQHPGIVGVLDAGEHDGVAWIAMEYLKGRDLRHYAQAQNLLPVAVVLRIGARVADALAHAHAQGVVHRDIKPANVMADLTGDSVKVTDFGIARIADASRTRTGVVLGTPSFMSPEQMAGGDVDGRSDVYSLGAMLFQLLSGHLPFEADSMHALMTQIANEPAPDVRAWRPELPEALANVVSLALQKRPEVRYAGAAQLADDLRAIESMLAADVKM